VGEHAQVVSGTLKLPTLDPPERSAVSDGSGQLVR
jgi:hypothetical protein